MKIRKLFLLSVFIMTLFKANIYAEVLTLYSVSGNTNNNLNSTIDAIKNSYGCEIIELKNLNGNNLITNKLTIKAKLSSDKSIINIYANMDAILTVLLYNNLYDHLTSYEYGTINNENKFLGATYKQLTNATILEEIGFNKLQTSNNLNSLYYEIDKVYILYNTDISSNSPTVTQPTEKSTSKDIRTFETTSETLDSKNISDKKNNVLFILIICAGFIILAILITILLIIFHLTKKNNQ